MKSGELCGFEGMPAAEKGRKPLAGSLRRLRTVFCSLAKHLHIRPRKQRLTDVDNTEPSTPCTPQKRTRMILGRTPTKLYSPFGIESPGLSYDRYNDICAIHPALPDPEDKRDRKGYRNDHLWKMLSSRY